jgi:SAM-dependent methyltransferase
MTVTSTDTWEEGKLYEDYMGRWSRLVASEFLAWLQMAPCLDWLDVGCGTGALTEAILWQARPRSVTGVDPSTGFVQHARAQIRDPRACFAVADAQSLPVEAARYDAAVAGLVLNFVPKPMLAVGEMVRAVRPAGVVAAYVWDYSGKMELMRCFWDAAADLDSSACHLDEGLRFPLCQPDPLRDLFSRAGLGQVQVQALDIGTHFDDFDDYWTPFLGGQGPAPAYAMRLSENRRTALRDSIRSKLPVAADGSISLMARAWAVRGQTPTLRSAMI